MLECLHRDRCVELSKLSNLRLYPTLQASEQEEALVVVEEGREGEEHGTYLSRSLPRRLDVKQHVVPVG